MSLNQPPILVTGATGKVGRQVVTELVRTGAAVRALARTPETADLPDGVEVVRGDLSVPSSLDAPLSGVEAVFLLWPFTTAEAAPAVVEAIGRHARHVVYLSAMSVRDDLDQQAGPITTFHAQIERLIKQSGLEWTILRSAGIATNALGWAPQIRAGDVVRWPYGEAARSLIHERDIAAVAARTLTSAGHRGATYALTGPQVLTQIEQVRTIGEAIGRSLRYEEIAPEIARQEMFAGMPPSVVDSILNAHAKFVEEPEPVTPTVEEITGVPARTFHQWAIDHAGDFR